MTLTAAEAGDRLRAFRAAHGASCGLSLPRAELAAMLRIDIEFLRALEKRRVDRLRRPVAKRLEAFLQRWEGR